MKYKFNFGSEVISLPRAAADYLHVASREKLAVLISLAAEPSMTAKKRAESLGLTESDVAEALAYWNALGVISPDRASKGADASGAAASAGAKQANTSGAAGSAGARQPAAAADNTDEASSGGESPSGAAKKRGADKAKAPAEDGKPIALMNDTPHMTTRELTGAAGDADVAQLLEHCQQLMGRVFNAAEAERIVAVRSYLGVSTDFIALLCKNLKDEGKLTVRSLENAAIELHDRGIADKDSLVEYFDRREKARSFEKKVRSLYGLGQRTLSAAEKKILDKWAALGANEEMIEFAYELTVDATGGASLKYSNAIIEKWAANGVKTVAEAKKREEQFRARTESKGSKSAKAAKAKKPENETVSSFETDDFFEKALRRSYGDDLFDEVIKQDGSDEKK